MLFEAIQRILLRLANHIAVTFDFGDDRGDRDSGYFLITFDDGFYGP